MTQSFPADIEAHIQGEISGQVAIGNNIVQIGSVHGGVVNIAVPEQRVRPRPRPTPVFLRPRPFHDLLNREAEINAADTVSRSAQPLEFSGEGGIGKTVLLRHLAHHSLVAAFLDGVVYLSARHQPLDDLLQSLYDAFYESDGPFKPTDAQLRHDLRDKQALVLLDDVALDRDEVEALLDVVPRCTCLLASAERCLWGEGRAVVLQGLPLDDAQALLERELGRPLTAEEQPAARDLCTALEGHPLRLLQAAATVRQEDRSLAEMARRAQSAPSSEALTRQLLDSLSESEQRVLAALAALNGASLYADHLSALTGIREVGSILESLQQRGLIQAHSPRYSLAGTLPEELRQIWDLSRWAERALTHFTNWVEEHRSATDRLLEESDAILQMATWGVRAGRWRESLRLGRAAEGALALGKRWGSWAEVLQLALRAAQSLGDQAAEAWALHQLGTRALCLGDVAGARPSLAQALGIREALGDQVGAEITRHNLTLLGPPPPSEPHSKPSPKAPPSGPSPVVIALVSMLVIMAVGVVVWIVWPSPPGPAPPPSDEVAIWLADGCDREYEPGSATQILLESNVDGMVNVQLDDQDLFDLTVAAGQRRERDWRVVEEPGEHHLTAVLDSGSRSECWFVVQEEEPSEQPRINVWLEGDCDREYRYGDQTRLLVEVSVDGHVEIRLDDGSVVEEQVWLTPEEPWQRVWTFEDLQPGGHEFRVVLRDASGRDLAEDVCPFRVGR